MGRRRDFDQTEATFRPHQPYERSEWGMARAAFALLGLVLAGCAGARPPEELTGLWSAGPAACAAGVGVRFRADVIEAVYDDETELLFAHPKYEIQDSGERFRVRILYDLPGGRAGGRGVVVLARQADGSLAPEGHALLDGRTGAARVRLQNDPVDGLLTLEPCGAHPWREMLRGRAQT